MGMELHDTAFLSHHALWDQIHLDHRQGSNAWETPKDTTGIGFLLVVSIWINPLQYCCSQAKKIISIDSCGKLGSREVKWIKEM